jgi:hypothetical protein
VYVKGATVSFPAQHTPGGSTYSYNAKVAQYVGAEVSQVGKCSTCTSDWLSFGQPTFGGNLQANKMFYSPGQPVETWAKGHNRKDQESTLPPSVLQLICLDDPKTTPAIAANYVKSIPLGQPVIMILSQEYEGGGKWTSPSAFLHWFVPIAAAIKDVGNPDVWVCADSSGYAYHKGQHAADGSWIVPPDYVDAYGLDCYQNQAGGKWPTNGLEGYDEFQNWLAHTGHSGKPLMICEYGVNNTASDAARAERIALDATYLLSDKTPPWHAWLYWYSDCTGGVLSTDAAHQHQFHDQPTIALWTAICKGTF